MTSRRGKHRPSPQNDRPNLACRAFRWATVALVAAGPSAIGAAPASAANWSPVTTGGSAYVFWRGADANLYQAQGVARAALSGPVSLGSGPLGGTPSAGVDGNGATYVYWKGTDSNLWESYWNGEQWVGPYNRGMGPLGSDPSVAITPAGTAFVFWRGADGNLWEAMGDARAGLSGPLDLGSGPLGGTPSAGVDGNGATYAYWKGADSNLWESYWNGEQWVGPYNRGMGPLGSDPSVAITPAGTAFVFWRGADGNLWEAMGDARAGLSGPLDLGSGPLGGTPSAGVDGNGATYAYWKGADSNLWENYWNGQRWTGPSHPLPASPGVTDFLQTGRTPTSLSLSFGYTGSSASSFSVTWSGGSITLPATARSVTIGGLSPSTAYCITVRPGEKWGLQTSPAATFCARTAPPPPPPADTPANVYLATQRTMGPSEQPPDCGSVKVTYTLSLLTPAGQTGPLTWPDTVSSGNATYSSPNWICGWSDTSRDSTQLVTGTWQISATSVLSNGVVWYASCTKTLLAGVNSVTFTYPNTGC